MGISKELTEEDVKFRYINEAITSKGWSKDSIFMEQKVKFTDGKINLHGNLVHREKPKFNTLSHCRGKGCQSFCFSWIATSYDLCPNA